MNREERRARPAWRLSGNQAKQAKQRKTPFFLRVATEEELANRQKQPERQVIATGCTASEEPGAWTCGLCGFRGFWSGGPHCMGGKK